MVRTHAWGVLTLLAAVLIVVEPSYAYGEQSLPDLPQRPSSWLTQIWTLPLFRLFAPAPTITEPLPPPPPVCLVQPLPVIDDLEALEFEVNVGSSAVVNLDGLTPPTARALARFEQVVTSVGGTVTLTSGYRPASYQSHLQSVWDKWMTELRFNQEPECLTLKAGVEAEFTAHQLLESQRPVEFSDHTRGISFDASVAIPRKGRRPSVDTLARRSGIHRPAVRRDPVHFRLIGG